MIDDFKQVFRSHTGTYNIKKALRGIYGVQQLINMVLKE